MIFYCTSDSVVGSINTICYMSTFLVKPGLVCPLPSALASAQPTWCTEAKGLLHPAWSRISSQPESTRGKNARDQAKGGFYQLRESQ